VRDAIVISGWNWEAANVPERVALALARAGARVLYCENPVSIARASARRLIEVEPGIFAFGLTFFGHRFNSFPPFSRIQDRLLANQILENARVLELRNPYFVYPHGAYCLRLGRIFKSRGLDLIHICMDFEPNLPEEHVRLSDMTFVIPLSTFQELKNRFAGKVHLLPQISTAEPGNFEVTEAPELSRISRPRLGYLGTLEGRVSLLLLRQILVANPEWQFISFEAHPQLAVPNEHVLRWRPRKELPAVLAGLDAGLMPYDCSIPKNLHCVPLKLYDYFSKGIPVVSTPIAHLNEYRDLVYVGRSPEELSRAICRALAEPSDSPKKNQRIAVAEQHSVGNISRILADTLHLTG
jgi:hypothetical protein